MSEKLRVALLGAGTVGSQVAKVLLGQSEGLLSRTGRPLEIVGIAVRNLAKERPGIPRELLTNDVGELLSRPKLDIVIELIGGIEPAREFVLAAIAAGASIITANKALIATHGAEIQAAADAAGVDVYYEAAVAGAIPIIRPLRESLVGDEITAVKGIVNGTTNFILEKMTNDGASYEEVLKQAQALGYAEADPTADVEGFDAASKAAILATLAFHTEVTLDDVSREGITGVTSADIAAAKEQGCVIKLLARCEVGADGAVLASVHPTMVPLGHPLASIPGAYNAVFIESRYAGRLMFMGPGAGGSPTASAVLGDVITAARNRARGVIAPVIPRSPGKILPAGEERSKFYVSMVVVDRPGVLADVAATFARHNVSLQAVRQDPGSEQARLGVVTHPARVVDMTQALVELERLDAVSPGVSMMRVEGE
ncbi:MAG: homoserine dehydrogenase [Propionibacteriaceae bacterium]|jgi:homoserine dehydrogenase|nr:homoserine dehydrogenase [Propionibacteriaceae bacterium]